MKRVVAVGLIAAVCAVSLLAVAASSIRLDPPKDPSNLTTAHAGRGLAALLENYDGGTFATIARDPTFARPEVYPDVAAAAYRDQRPLLGELAWLVSLGDPHRVPLAMALLSVLATVFAVVAVAVLLLRRGLSPFLALALFALPGVLTVVYDMMAELLQLGLLTAGLLAWESRPRRTRWAVLLFTLAALTRETSLFVPIALAAVELMRLGTRSGRSAMRHLAIPVAVYGAWITFVRVRVGAWPFAAHSGRLTFVPFGGLVHTVRYSPYRSSALPWIAVGAALLAAAIIRGQRDVWYATAIAFAVLGVFLGWNVWQRPDDFGRVLLPMYAYSAIVAGSALWSRSPSAPDRSTETPAETAVA